MWTADALRRRGAFATSVALDETGSHSCAKITRRHIRRPAAHALPKRKAGIGPAVSDRSASDALLLAPLLVVPLVPSCATSSGEADASTTGKARAMTRVAARNRAERPSFHEAILSALWSWTPPYRRFRLIRQSVYGTNADGAPDISAQRRRMNRHARDTRAGAQVSYRSQGATSFG